jgi:hypothetical protein
MSSAARLSRSPLVRWGLPMVLFSVAGYYGLSKVRRGGRRRSRHGANSSERGAGGLLTCTPLCALDRHHSCTRHP